MAIDGEDDVKDPYPEQAGEQGAILGVVVGDQDAAGFGRGVATAGRRTSVSALSAPMAAAAFAKAEDRGQGSGFSPFGNSMSTNWRGWRHD
ncbi:MAG: hypothetical protein H7A53_05755 [Akkermansiaceae bacterium]|nr:hypothetical protein [Akkermansiaceae bacterium]